MGNYLIGNRTSDVIHAINNCFLKLNPTIKYKWTNNQDVLFDDLQYDLILVKYCCPSTQCSVYVADMLGNTFCILTPEEISNWGQLGKCSKSSQQHTQTYITTSLYLSFLLLFVLHWMNKRHAYMESSTARQHCRVLLSVNTIKALRPSFTQMFWE